MKANELKKGSVFQVEGQNILVKHVQVQSPSSRSGSTLYKVKGQNVATRQKYERSFKGDEVVGEVDFVRRPVQWLYRDSDGCTFMDSENYEQHIVSEELISEEFPFIRDQGINSFQSFADEPQPFAQAFRVFHDARGLLAELLLATQESVGMLRDVAVP